MKPCNNWNRFREYKRSYEKLEGTRIKTCPKEELDPYGLLFDALYYLYYMELLEEITICISHPRLNENQEDLLVELREHLTTSI